MSHWPFHNNRFLINDSGDESSHSSYSIRQAIPKCCEFGDVMKEIIKKQSPLMIIRASITNR